MNIRDVLFPSDFSVASEAAARETEELICEACRTQIRGEALEHKIDEERPGHRDLPA